MTLWRLEWLRLVRTKRWIALLGVFVFFGLLGPFTARYLAEILSFAGSNADGITIEFPPPVPADGLAQFSSGAAQIGTLVAVIVAAGSLAIDAIPEMGKFLRTRVRDIREIITPRFVVSTGAVVGSYLLGVAVAWYETWVLIGPPDAGAVVAGAALGSVFLVFAVALVAAVSGRATSVLNTVMIALVILVLMPVVGAIPVVGRWLPSYLASAIAALPAGTADATDYVGALCVTFALIVALLWAALYLARRRET